MKNLIVLLPLIILSFNSQSQCYIPNKPNWNITDGINIITDQGFVIVTHFPNNQFSKGKTNFEESELLSENGGYQKEYSYFYFFDFTIKQLDLHDCNGIIQIYKITKIKQKGDTFYISVKQKGEKTKFKVVFGEDVNFTQITYLKKQGVSEILFDKRASYFTNK